MIHCKTRLLLLPALLLALMAVPAQKADAGLVPDIWNAVFGPPGTPYFGRTTTYSAGYYPRYGVGYYPRYSVGYAPVSYRFVAYRGSCCLQRIYYVPACSPCATTDPCPINSASGKLTPPVEEKPQTFKKKSPDGTKPQGKDSKFKSRGEEKKFQATPDGEKKSPFPEGNGDGKTPSGKQKTFKKPEKTPPLTVIPKKKPAPSKPPKEDSNAKPKEKKNDGPKIQGLRLDEKITWRTLPARNRLVIHGRISRTKLARTRIDPNRGWTPVREGTRLVRQ